MCYGARIKALDARAAAAEEASLKAVTAAMDAVRTLEVTTALRQAKAEATERLLLERVITAEKSVYVARMESTTAKEEAEISKLESTKSMELANAATLACATLYIDAVKSVEEIMKKRRIADISEGLWVRTDSTLKEIVKEIKTTEMVGDLAKSIQRELEEEERVLGSSMPTSSSPSTSLTITAMTSRADVDTILLKSLSHRAASELELLQDTANATNKTLESIETQRNIDHIAKQNTQHASSLTKNEGVYVQQNVSLPHRQDLYTHVPPSMISPAVSQTAMNSALAYLALAHK